MQNSISSARPRAARSTVVVLLGALGLAAACAGNEGSAASATTSNTAVVSTDDPSAADTEPTSDSGSDRSEALLSAEPRVLYEWYAEGRQAKSIVMSDESLAGPAVQVVPDSEGAAVHANWSRDGSMFTWEVLRDDDTASVWTANADGSDPVERVVCQESACAEISFPSFGHDDSQLLVVRYDTATDGNWGPSHLVLVDLGSGVQTIIASTPDGTSSFYLPTMSPDGSQVAAALERYTDSGQGTRTGSEIVVVDADPTTADSPIAISDPALFAGYPRWHPSDDRILFASWDLDAFQGDEESQLYTVAPDGSAPVQVTKVDYSTSRRRPGEANWTPDGQRIIASIGVVSGARVVDVKVAYIDPTTGEISETTTSGAMPSLQP